jgi:hypothetical protein
MRMNCVNRIVLSTILVLAMNVDAGSFRAAVYT